MKVSFTRNNSNFFFVGDYIFARRAHIFARVSFDIDRTMFAWARGWSVFSEISFFTLFVVGLSGMGASARF